LTQPSPLASPPAWDLVSAAYVQDVVPAFTPFSEDALRFAGVREGQLVLDVAAGPGTLAFAAAKLGASVRAIDFSTRMVDELNARAAREEIRGVEARVGDGQALPFDDASFDAAFSMFGLMFFPDRVQGFRELRRVLRPGAPAVVSAWQPMERVPVLAEIFAIIRELLPGIPFGAPKAPLGEAADFLDEMSQAGFHDIRVHEAAHGFDTESVVDFWEISVRSNAAIVVLRDRLGERWTALDTRLREQLRARFGDGPQHVTMAANLGVARA
jgi:ubiquinone/menaquinone biosynthesis C-methylase UbiE